ncbi:phosphatidylinositol 3-kinase [Plasmodium sp. gorilla clade G3]|nr:phosphatidylinositol 3-kinase [Plasmodium sp. gorilla clade G3]
MKIRYDKCSSTKDLNHFFTLKLGFFVSYKNHNDNYSFKNNFLQKNDTILFFKKKKKFMYLKKKRRKKKKKILIHTIQEYNKYNSNVDYNQQFNKKLEKNKNKKKNVYSDHTNQNVKSKIYNYDMNDDTYSSYVNRKNFFRISSFLILNNEFFGYPLQYICETEGRGRKNKHYHKVHGDNDKNDESYDNKNDESYDNKNDESYDNKNDESYDNKNDESYDNKNDESYDNKNDESYDNKNDESYDNKNDECYDNKNDECYDNNYDKCYDNKNNKCYDNKNNKCYDKKNNKCYDNKNNKCYDNKNNKCYDNKNNKCYDNKNNKCYDKKNNKCYDNKNNKCYDNMNNKCYDNMNKKSRKKKKLNKLYKTILTKKKKKKMNPNLCVINKIYKYPIKYCQLNSRAFVFFIIKNVGVHKITYYSYCKLFSKDGVVNQGIQICKLYHVNKKKKIKLIIFEALKNKISFSYDNNPHNINKKIYKFLKKNCAYHDLIKLFNFKEHRERGKLNKKLNMEKTLGLHKSSDHNYKKYKKKKKIDTCKNYYNNDSNDRSKINYCDDTLDRNYNKYYKYELSKKYKCIKLTGGEKEEHHMEYTHLNLNTRKDKRFYKELYKCKYIEKYISSINYFSLERRRIFNKYIQQGLGVNKNKDDNNKSDDDDNNKSDDDDNNKSDDDDNNKSDDDDNNKSDDDDNNKSDDDDNNKSDDDDNNNNNNNDNNNNNNNDNNNDCDYHCDNVCMCGTYGNMEEYNIPPMRNNTNRQFIRKRMNNIDIKDNISNSKIYKYIDKNKFKCFTYNSYKNYNICKNIIEKYKLYKFLKKKKIEGYMILNFLYFNKEFIYYNEHKKDMSTLHDNLFDIISNNENENMKYNNICNNNYEWFFNSFDYVGNLEESITCINEYKKKKKKKKKNLFYNELIIKYNKKHYKLNNFPSLLYSHLTNKKMMNTTQGNNIKDEYYHQSYIINKDVTRNKDDNLLSNSYHNCNLENHINTPAKEIYKEEYKDIYIYNKKIAKMNIKMKEEKKYIFMNSKWNPTRDKSKNIKKSKIRHIKKNDNNKNIKKSNIRHIKKKDNNNNIKKSKIRHIKKNDNNKNIKKSKIRYIKKNDSNKNNKQSNSKYIRSDNRKNFHLNTNKKKNSSVKKYKSYHEKTTLEYNNIISSKNFALKEETEKNTKDLKNKKKLNDIFEHISKYTNRISKNINITNKNRYDDYPFDFLSKDKIEYISMLSPTINEIKTLNSLLTIPLIKMNEYEKNCIWRFRFQLLNRKETIGKFLKCINWENKEEEEEAIILLNKWAKPALENCIELFYSHLHHYIIKKYIIDIIKNSKKEEIKLYLFQLVQSLRTFNYQHIDNLFINTLIEKCMKSKKLSIYFHWFLLSEAKDKMKGKLYLHIHKLFINKLMTCNVRKNKIILDILKNQNRFRNQLLYLTKIAKNKTDRIQNKTKKLRHFLFYYKTNYGYINIKEFIKNNIFISHNNVYDFLHICKMKNSKSVGNHIRGDKTGQAVITGIIPGIRKFIDDNNKYDDDNNKYDDDNNKYDDDNNKYDNDNNKYDDDNNKYDNDNNKYDNDNNKYDNDNNKYDNDNNKYDNDNNKYDNDNNKYDNDNNKYDDDNNKHDNDNNKHDNDNNKHDNDNNKHDNDNNRCSDDDKNNNNKHIRYNNYVKNISYEHFNEEPYDNKKTINIYTCNKDICNSIYYLDKELTINYDIKNDLYFFQYKKSSNQKILNLDLSIDSNDMINYIDDSKNVSIERNRDNSFFSNFLQFNDNLDFFLNATYSDEDNNYEILDDSINFVQKQKIKKIKTPLILPIDPNIELLSFLPEQSYVLRSSLYPIVISFLVRKKIKLYNENYNNLIINNHTYCKNDQIKNNIINNLSYDKSYHSYYNSQFIKTLQNSFENTKSINYHYNFLKCANNNIFYKNKKIERIKANESIQKSLLFNKNCLNINDRVNDSNNHFVHNNKKMNNDKKDDYTFNERIHTCLNNSCLSDKHLLSSDKKLLSSDKKLLSSDKNLLSSDKNLLSSDKKMLSSDKHMSSCDKHMSSCDKRMSSCDKLMSSCDKHMCSCDKHMCSCDKHMSSCDKHMSSCDKHMSSNDKHMSSNDKLMSSNDKLMSSCDKLMSSCDKLMSSNDVFPLGGKKSKDEKNMSAKKNRKKYNEIYQLSIKKYIYKAGDDLRQDHLVIQIIYVMDNIWKRYGLDLKMTLYRVLALSTDDGFIEFVDYAESISSIKKNYKGEIRQYFIDNSTCSSSPLGFDTEILQNFISSCAGYSVITYILGIGDRHLDNLMVTKDGRFFHIDFGYIFGEDPKPFSPPMKLCKEMIEAMGGAHSIGYEQFLKKCCLAYKYLRYHSQLIISLLDAMCDAGLKDMKTSPELCVLKVQEKFRLDLNDEAAEIYFLSVINASVKTLFPVVVDKLHEWALNWK